jgi:aminomethyltransferase
MGYVASDHAAIGTRLAVIIRGTAHPASVVSMPFTPHRYHRKIKSGTKHD